MKLLVDMEFVAALDSPAAGRGMAGGALVDGRPGQRSGRGNHGLRSGTGLRRIDARHGLRRNSGGDARRKTERYTAQDGRRYSANGGFPSARGSPPHGAGIGIGRTVNRRPASGPCAHASADFLETAAEKTPHGGDVAGAGGVRRRTGSWARRTRWARRGGWAGPRTRAAMRGEGRERVWEGVALAQPDGHNPTRPLGALT